MALEHVLNHWEIEHSLNQCASEITNNFLEDYRCSYTFENQSLSACQGIEAMWFLIDNEPGCQDKFLMELAAYTIITTLEYSRQKP